MKAVIHKLSPNAAEMIRADHTRVLATFHRYDIDASPSLRQALVNSICLSLEVHAQIEEEIFYPALREAKSTLVGEFEREHAEMRSLIAALRGMQAADPQYDQTFMELMRAVMHHVADEETMLLPNAESLMGSERLGELGGRMMARRVGLTVPRAGEIARSAARANPTNAALVAMGALIAGMYVFRQARRRHA
jgi:hemerythrin superfamily protein